MKDYADKIALRVLEEFTGREGTLGYSAGFTNGQNEALGTSR